MNLFSHNFRVVAARSLSLAVVLGALVAPIVHAETIRMGGTGAAIGTFQALAEEYKKVDPSFRLDILPNLGSSGGIKALLGGAVQIAATSRPVKSEEQAKGARSIEYGRTAFVLATTKAGVDGLSTRDIAELYAGRHATWPDGQPVRLVLRPASDGDWAMLAEFSPAIKAGLEQAMAREGMVVGMTDQEAVDAIERLPGGLGTASIALLVSESRRARPLAIDGVAPTLENLASGRYRHVKNMYLVLRDDAPPAAVKFAEFIRSEAGQRVLVKTGHQPAAMPKIAAR